MILSWGGVPPNKHPGALSPFSSRKVICMKIQRAIFIIVVGLLLLLVACNIGGIEDNAVEAAGVGQNYAAAPDSRRSSLYERAGLSPLQLQTARRLDSYFNLRLSHNNLFYTEDIGVEIFTDVEGAEIYYTLDGSYPRRGVNTRNNRRFTGEPIRIMAGDFNEPTVLRATAFLGDIRSKTLTHTYFVSSMIHERFDENLFVFSIVSDPVHLYDHDYGILVPGRLREEFIAANPGRDIIPPDPANFNVRGMAGERPAHVEVFNSRGELLISQSIGIRVRGGWSRSASRKSLGLYARSMYDPVFDRFNYDFFRFFNDLGRGRKTIRGTDTPVEAFTQIVLRNGANDRGAAHMREEFTHVTAKRAGFLDYKGVAPAAMFINGVYYGFFWLQYMYPTYYFFDHYGEVGRGDIEVLYWWELPDARGVTDDEVFEAFTYVMDLDNFMRYFALQIFAANWDWPHNNMKGWRYVGPPGGELINRYFDGRIRMLLYDTESWGMNSRARDRVIRRVRDSSPTFRNLLQREDMVEKFCNHMWDLIHSALTPWAIYDTHSRIVELQEPEIRFAISRGVSSTSNSTLNRERQVILDFATNRASYVADDMASSFRLSGELYYVTAVGKPGATIRLNTLELTGAGSLFSSYFAEHSVRLSTDSGQFSHWIINGQQFETREVILGHRLAQNGIIRAELFLE